VTASGDTTRGSEFWGGFKAELPLALGVIPFGMIYGVLALEAGIPANAALAMSSIVFAGSSQFITTQLASSGTPALIMVLTILIVNLRHILYSASLAPHLKHLSAPWKAGLAYLLTDEAYAMTITHFNRAGNSPHKHWFFLGAGLTLWSSWQISSAAGIYLGVVVPASWSLDFTLALTFIALLVPNLKDRPALAAAVTAGLVALATIGLPYKLGLILAAIAGISAGAWAERWS
jgi:4-azaleucine resistance transporter AzlC